VLHKPKLLILDEPFSGLDPINTNLIKDEIRKLNEQGTSIIFSTHQMEQVEAMCEYIVLINKGKNVLTGRVDDIKQQFKENLFRIEYAGTLPTGLQAADDANPLFHIQDISEDTLTVKIFEGGNSNDILRHLIQHDIHINSFREILPSINEIFIKRVGEDGNSEEGEPAIKQIEK